MYVMWHKEHNKFPVLQSKMKTELYLYWGAGKPLASQVRVASSSGKPTGTIKSLGSIRHFGPWNDL